jgi:hypothetical protein
VLRTIGDVRAYMLALPKARALRGHWQHASRPFLEEASVAAGTMLGVQPQDSEGARSRVARIAFPLLRTSRSGTSVADGEQINLSQASPDERNGYQSKRYKCLMLVGLRLKR